MNAVFERILPIMINGVDGGVCQIKGFDFSDRDDFRIEYAVDNGPMESIQSDGGVFNALCALRRVLEKIGIFVMCNASALDVYPSPMQIAMGNSTLAYRNTLGQQALAKDIVDMLDLSEVSGLATVDEQEAFHQRWLASL